MTAHEFLWYVKAVHDKVEASVSNRGHWCWPTRELLNWNIRQNRALINPSGREQQFARALAKGWILVGPCAPHCHGPHVSLTALGEATLARMMAQGCSSGCACREREEAVRLDRKIEQRRA